MKELFFCDFDGVMMDTEAAFNAFLQEHYGVAIPPGSHHCGYSMESLVLNQIPEDSRPTLGEFFEFVGAHFLTSMEWHKDVLPIPESVEVLTELSQCIEVIVVTARNVSSKHVVGELVRKFFPDAIRRFHFVYTCIGNGQFKAIPKRDYIERFTHRPRLAFIDDNPHEVRSVADITPSFLFDPNGHYPDETGYTRIKSWNELAHRFL